jgi:hypothetical protein
VSVTTFSREQLRSEERELSSPPLAPSCWGKTFQGKLLPHCNKWLRWTFVQAAWVAIGCSAYFGDFYKRERAIGKKPKIAILATARLDFAVERSASEAYTGPA